MLVSFEALVSKKLGGVLVLGYDPTVISFNALSACDGRTDGHATYG